MLCISKSVAPDNVQRSMRMESPRSVRNVRKEQRRSEHRGRARREHHVRSRDPQCVNRCSASLSSSLKTSTTSVSECQNVRAEMYTTRMYSARRSKSLANRAAVSLCSLVIAHVVHFTHRSRYRVTHYSFKCFESPTVPDKLQILS